MASWIIANSPIAHIESYIQKVYIAGGGAILPTALSRPCIDLPLIFHPALIRVSARVAPEGGQMAREWIRPVIYTVDEPATALAPNAKERSPPRRESTDRLRR